MNQTIKIRNEADCTVIDIEGTIGVSEEWQFENPASRVATYERFKECVSQIADIDNARIVVNIRSTGGDVNDALLIYEALRNPGAHITTRCYGYTASAATIVAQAASEGCRQVAPSSLYLIHNSLCSAEGNADELQQEIEMLRQTDRRLAEIYATRANRSVEEILYPAMEDFALDLMMGKGPSARSIRLDLPKFTLVGATTRSGLLTSPLRARFGITCHLEYYDAPVLANIIKRSASILDISIDDDAAMEIALRSRGTPRIANALLRRVRAFAQVMGNGHITNSIAKLALEALNIDKYGLDEIDNKILCTIIDKFKGGPVGIGTIATALSEDTGTIEEVYEPYLIKEGFIKRTPRGREVTDLAYKHLGRSRYNNGEQGTLF